MLKNLTTQFFRKALYGVLANTATALIFVAQGYHPQGGPVAALVWSNLVVGGLTGLAGVIRRAIAYDPTKA